MAPVHCCISRMAVFLLCCGRLLSGLQLTATKSDTINVACIGDSLTEGGCVNPPEAYPAQLQDILGPDYLVKNFGSAGSFVNSGSPGSYYLNRGPALEAIAMQPEIVLMQFGRTGVYMPEQVFSTGYKEVINRFPGARVVLVVSPPTYEVNETAEAGYIEVVQNVKKIGNELGLKVVDLYQPWLAMCPDVSSSCDVMCNSCSCSLGYNHPNPGGYRKMAELVASQLGLSLFQQGKPAARQNRRISLSAAV